VQKLVQGLRQSIFRVPRCEDARSPSNCLCCSCKASPH
jgi:hypothetical protein